MTSPHCFSISAVASPKSGESLSTIRFCQHGRQVAEVKLGRERRL